MPPVVDAAVVVELPVVDSSTEQITTIEVTIVAITTTVIHVIMTIMTFPERAPMVTVIQLHTN